MKKIALHNLGCKVNSYEIEVMQQKLQEKGYLIVNFDEIADIYIVNTCTVTNIADRKSRQILHRAKQLNPKAVVVAVGCYVQTGKEAIEKDEAIDLAIGNNRKKDIVEILEEYLREREMSSEADSESDDRAMEMSGREELRAQTDLQECGTGKVDKTLHGTTILDINHTYEYEEMQLTQTAEHTRAYIKIQDGCNQFCSYCAIPYARGRVRSRKAEDIIREVKGLVAAGYREVVLTGIHISSYGIDFEAESWEQGISREMHKGERLEYTGSSKLVDLTEAICKIDGLDRVRLGSLEPRVITEEAAKRLSKCDKLCPHFHLSLQSGCDATLKRMNRHYTAEEYYASVEYLRKYFAHPAITTDVIVGFPGETAEEFQQTRAFLEKVAFYEMHIFKYSKRAGTVAATMPGQIPEQEKTARSNVLQEMEQRHSEEFRRRYLGQEAEVLLEEEREIQGNRYFVGHTRDYVKVAVPVDGTNAVNSLVKVKIAGFLTNEILM